jgi:uncharacterized protein YjbI with pentapeptide repeats
MAEERCRWFEGDWSWGIPTHSVECPYLDEYLVPGTERCIFHLPKEHEEKAKRFRTAFVEVLSDEPVVWPDKNNVEYIDLFGFIFPDDFPLKDVLVEHPPKLPLCLVVANLQGANLQWAHLQGANLYKGRLQGAYLTGADLQGADLREVHLHGAYLTQANLQYALLNNVCLQSADLSWAHLQGADLRWAQLQGADLSDAQLQGADLYGADLQDAFLLSAHLQGADLSDAQLQGAKLWLSHLQGACLIEAHLQGADLRDAHLQGADLDTAHLQGANLKGAHLHGANLKLAYLQGADLSHAQLCANPGYRVSEEWDKWIKNSENNERMKKRLLGGKERLSDGLGAANLIKADLGAGQCKGNTKIKLTAIEGWYREKTSRNMEEYVGSQGIVIPVYSNGNEEAIEAVELELAPAVLEGTDLRGVDLSESTIAGADFTYARLDGTLLRGTEFGVKKQDKDGKRRYDSRWRRKNRRLYASEIENGRIELFKFYRSLKPKWLRFLLKPLIRLYVRATMIKADLPIFNGANTEAADWADNRRAQRDFVYAEYIRQFKDHHPRIAKLWSFTCDYGRTLKRWAALSAAFMILFGALFYASHILYKADDNWFTRNVLPQVELRHDLQKDQPTEFSYFYFSAVTFTTLGFGDVTPVNLAGQIAVTIEVILGYVMLGGLISIFAVKVARRD